MGGHRWHALIAAFFGWMFDGFEMGLFPVVARPALWDLLQGQGVAEPEVLETLVGQWNGIAIAGFLLGAATGGVVFGWLGDRLGRVKALSLSILTYSLVSGLGAFATTPWQIVVVRFLAALGMGGEWSLGVALVMEVWQGQSRVMLAGLIGTAVNLGFALVALLSLGLGSVRHVFTQWGFSNAWVEWRLLMLSGVLPALLVFFVRLWVRESESWLKVRRGGGTTAWATRDLAGVLVGALAGLGILVLWSYPLPTGVRLVGTILALIVVGLGFLYPVFRYLRRWELTAADSGQAIRHRQDAYATGDILRRMALGAFLSGVPLLGTWAAVQWAPIWADQLAVGQREAKSLTQFYSAMGAFFCAPLGAWMAGRLGRRMAYLAMCLISLASLLLFYGSNAAYTHWFLATVFLMGGLTSLFYGWLPLYLPELFPTRVRAIGQGFSYNFGRVIAAMGALQTGTIMSAFSGGYPQACTTMGSVYLLGILAIWFAPETSSSPLPD